MCLLGADSGLVVNSLEAVFLLHNIHEYVFNLEPLYYCLPSLVK